LTSFLLLFFVLFTFM